jgi:hypothetical protein
MSELLSMGLFWFFILAELFTFFMQRTTRDWRGANQVVPEIMSLVWMLCGIALLVLIVFIFIKVKPWWYGLVMLAAQFILSTCLPVGKTGEIIIAMIGIIAAPLFVILSFLKVFAVI